MSEFHLTRRSVLTLVSMASLAPALPALAQSRPLVTVYKDPSCGCCGAWVKHIAAAGFPTAVQETADMTALKARLGVPMTLGSCHTAKVGSYLLEGHVPAAALEKLLTENPDAMGLAVPGMPVGSPGMEVAGTPPERYDVLLFAKDRPPRPYMRFNGGAEIQ